MYICGIVIYNFVASRCPYDGDFEFHYVHHVVSFSHCYRSYEYCDYKYYNYYYNHARFLFLNLTTLNCSKFIVYF